MKSSSPSSLTGETTAEPDDSGGQRPSTPLVLRRRLNRESHLDVPRQCVRIVRDLYVDNDLFDGPGDIVEAHPMMVVLKSVRKWGNVPTLAERRMLTTRYLREQQAADQPDWTRFDELKASRPSLPAKGEHASSHNMFTVSRNTSSPS